MKTPKYTYIPALRGGLEKSFDNFEDALEYVLSISTADFVMDYLNDYMGEGFFTRDAVKAMLETKETDKLLNGCLDYLIWRFCTDKFKPITENMWYLGHGWRLRKKEHYE